MRPLQLSDRSIPASALYEADRILEVVGPYCGLCERPLHDNIALWDTDRDVLVPHVDEQRWTALLPLCVDCTDWQQRSARDLQADALDSNTLALPHHALTFTLRDNSPYQYNLVTAIRTIVGDDNGPTEQSEVAVAIVSGSTDAARRTIDRFKLNTPYYDENTRTITIPRQHYLSATDRRLDLRTAVWKRAESMIDPLLKLSQQPKLASVTSHVRLIAEHTGFWSVWVTLLWRATNDRALIAQIFDPPPRQVAVTNEAGPSNASLILHRATDQAYLS